MITGKTIALTRWTFVGKVLSLLSNVLSRLVVTLLPRSERLLISWLLERLEKQIEQLGQEARVGAQIAAYVSW